MPNWEVVVYDMWLTDEDDECLGTSNRVMACWRIEGRTESEAFREAAADVRILGHEVAYWTMREVE